MAPRSQNAPAVGGVPARLPSKEKLRASLKITSDLSVLNRYLQIVAQQPKGAENGLRILLQTCADLGNDKFVEALLCRRVNVQASNKTSLPPLHCAAKAGHCSTIELLLRYNATLEAKDSAGRTALMHAAMNGQAQAVRTLLDKGADIGATDRQKRNAVIHAASGSHGDTLAVLLQLGADPEHIDDTGKTASMYAAANNDPPVLSLLLSHMSHIVSPRALDKDGRSVLDYAIANEKATLQDKKAREEDKRTALQDKKDVLAMLLEGRFGVRQNKHSLQAVRRAAHGGQNEILTILIAHKANVNATDDNGRTSLHILASDTTKDPSWNEQTVTTLLEAGVDVFKIDHDRATGRRRTALQWAAATGRQVVAKAILRDMEVEFVKAHVNSASSRGKTAMHLAAQHNNADMIRLLRNHDARIDPRSEGDWTPLLIAAKAGHLEAVEALLGASEPANINARTSSGMTSLHWAAENGHNLVVQRILQDDASWKNPKDTFDTTPLSRAYRRGHRAIVELFKDCLFTLPPGDAGYACDQFTASVVDFFLARGEHDPPQVRRMPVRHILYDRDPKTKDKFAITTRLDDIQKGAPSFRWIHLPANNLAWAEALITKMIVEDGPIDVSGFQSMLRIFGQQQHRGSKVHSRFMRPLCQLHGSSISTRHARAPAVSLTEPGPLTRESTTTFDESPFLNRRLNVPAGSMLPTPATPPHSATGSPTPSPQNSGPPSNSKELERPLAVPAEVGVLFMPYLHWETDSKRECMRDTVHEVMGTRSKKYSSTSNEKDACLIRGYLRHSTDLHLRRTLDQFRHHSINTDKRDRDQVVYRHHVERAREAKPAAEPDPKIFMVDQMWIWMFRGIIITAFPERWGQPIRDPLNLFDGVIEDISSGTFPPVKTVQDLAAAITNRCTGSFDRHEWGYEDLDFMFFEIFELSIGTLTRRATALLERFEKDSSAAGNRLKARDKSWQSIEPVAEKDADQENEEDKWLKDPDEDYHHHHRHRHGRNPIFVNRLLNISKETQLLVECKDIEDELAILTTVLEQQHSVLKHMSTALKISKRRAGLQVRLVEQHLLDISRMQRQAQGVNSSLTQVLDLKQKHANAIEARFARDQAEDTARQGQTIMVFTIVTIIFLPLTFVAAFLTINIKEFPHDSTQGGNGLPLSWVSKYVFGIGFAVSVPLIVLAFVFTDAKGWLWQANHLFGGQESGVNRSHREQQAYLPSPVPTTQVDKPFPVVTQTSRAASTPDSGLYIWPRRQNRANTGLTERTGRSMDSEDV